MPAQSDCLGHRQRLKDRFLQNGERGLSDHELLELLLFYAIARKDVKPLAKELLRKFHSLQGVLMADTRELLLIKGISVHTAILLQMGRSIFTRCLQQSLNKTPVLDTNKALHLYLRLQFGSSRTEQICMLLLNKNCRLIDKIILPGHKNMAYCDPQELLQCILFHKNVTGVVLAHNHPQGSEIPSANDIITTKRLQFLLKELKITLKDHFIVTQNKCFSILNSEAFQQHEPPIF